MTIIDYYGNPITVTDLGEAIEQAAYFKDAHHVPSVESDKERQAYWTDMYTKLLKLQTKKI